MEQISPEQIVAMAPLSMSELDRRIMAGIGEPSRRDLRLFHLIKNTDYFRLLLRTGALSLCRCDKFEDDEADGLLPEPNRNAESETMRRLYADLERHATIDGKKLKMERDPQQEYDSQVIARLTAYVHCWFSGPAPSAEMWAKYGQHGSGICIQTTARALTAAIPRQHPFGQVLLGSIAYSDCTQPIGTFLSYLPFFHKHDRYAFENEVRIVALVSPDPRTGEYRVEQERMPLKLDIRSAIHRVVIGSRVPLETEQQLRGDLAGFVGPIPVVKNQE